MARDKAFAMISLVIHARVFAKEKEFYSANGAYVLTNKEDAMKCFYSVYPMMN